MKEILNFIDEGIQLCLFINNGNLVYGKRLDDKISYDITDNQRELIKNVFYSLLPSNIIKDLGYIKYNNKSIKHLYDLNNNYHIFYEDNYQITEDILNLNSLFNNQEEYLASYNKKNSFKRSESRYTRRRVKIKDKVIPVLVLSTSLILMTLLSIEGIKRIDFSIQNYKENELVSKYQDNDVKLEDIIQFINSNPNLTNEEKEFFLSCPEYFQDNLEYFDYYTLVNNLSNIYINYINDPSNDGFSGDYTYYGKNKNRIRIYESTDFTNCKKSALSHEYLHSFTNHSLQDNYFYEIVNVIFNNEYFGSDSELFYDSSYPTLRKYFYIIAEIIDPNILRQYHANNDINYLIEELIKIIPDRDLATNLFLNIDFIFRIDLLKETDPIEYEKYKEEYKLKKQEVDNLLKQYYEIKYQSSIENNINVFYWFNQNVAVTKIAAELNLDRTAILNADNFTAIKQFKKVFNKDDNDNDNLILYIPNGYKEVEKIYTLEEVLNGETGFLYKTEEEIDLPKLPDGRYLGVVYLPSTYLDYQVPYEFSKELTGHI
ncbi:MAG: hypothetical protein IJ501_06850 [Bacilli bacterium]|nr:hypothetical protein [Bacilli bacterium]